MSETRFETRLKHRLRRRGETLLAWRLRLGLSQRMAMRLAGSGSYLGRHEKLVFPADVLEVAAADTGIAPGQLVEDAMRAMREMSECHDDAKT